MFLLSIISKSVAKDIFYATFPLGGPPTKRGKRTLRREASKIAISRTLRDAAQSQLCCVILSLTIVTMALTQHNIANYGQITMQHKLLAYVFRVLLSLPL